MKKLILSAAILFTGMASIAQNRVLYFCDGLAGTDYMAPALTSTGCVVTSVTTHAAFQTEVANTANYDIVIHFIQSNYPEAASVTGLANFMAIPGKKGMYSDWSTDNTFGAQVGVSFTGNTNESPVTITDPVMAAGLVTNPFPVSQPGWGIYATSMTPLSGSTVAGTFPSGDAALIKSMGDRMLVFGYTTDAVTSSEVFVNAVNFLLGSVTPTNTITTTPFSGALCPGETTSIAFSSTGTFTGTNVFTAELSDATGSFATPVAIGTLSGATGTSVSATIPTTASGSAYRVRIVASDPATLGSDNGTDLVIMAPTAVVTASAITCNGGMSTVTVTGTGGVSPYTGTGTFMLPAGAYSYTVNDANGCASVAATGTITEPAPVNVNTSVSGITITAAATPATYQWLDCNNSYTVIAGATASTFTAAANGQYAVAVTESGCTDTSNCVTINTVGLDANSNNTMLDIYPNPASGFFTVNMQSANAGNITLTVTDLQGKTVLTMHEAAASTYTKNISLNGIAPGMYYVNVNMNGMYKTAKLVIQ